MKSVFLVYYIDVDGKVQYCVSSGGMNFSTDVNNGYQYDKTTAIRIGEYLKRTRTCHNLEVGYLEVSRTAGVHKPI